MVGGAHDDRFGSCACRCQMLTMAGLALASGAADADDARLEWYLVVYLVALTDGVSDGHHARLAVARGAADAHDAQLKSYVLWPWPMVCLMDIVQG